MTAVFPFSDALGYDAKSETPVEYALSWSPFAEQFGVKIRLPDYLNPWSTSMQKSFLNATSMVPGWAGSFFTVPTFYKEQAAAAEADVEYYAAQAQEQMQDITNAAQDMLAHAIEAGTQTTQTILDNFTGAFQALQAPAAEVVTEMAETSMEMASSISNASKAGFEASVEMTEQAVDQVTEVTADMMAETAQAVDEFDMAALTPSILFEESRAVENDENSAAYTTLMTLPGVDVQMARRLFEMGYANLSAFSNLSDWEWLDLENQLGFRIDRSAWMRRTTRSTKRSATTKEMRMPENLYATTLEERDDLTRLGLGPETVEVLFDLGVYEFRQVAEWDDAEARWIRAVAKQYGAEFTSKDWRKEAAELA